MGVVKDLAIEEAKLSAFDKRDLDHVCEMSIENFCRMVLFSYRERLVRIATAKVLLKMQARIDALETKEGRSEQS